MKKEEKYSSIKHKLKLFTNILSWTLFVLLILVAIILVYYFIDTKSHGKNDPNYRPAFGLYTIISPSMEPNLNIYDVIVNVKVKKPEDIKIGDIITFISNSAISKGMTITHRVVSITDTENGKLYQTKGDNNEKPDTKPATYDQILGKVIFKIPQLGRLQSILSTKGGWLIIVVIPAFIIILFDVLKLLRLYGAEKNIQSVILSDEKKKEQERINKKEIENRLTTRYENKKELDNKVLTTIENQKEPNKLLTPNENKKELDSKLLIKDEIQKESESLSKPRYELKRSAFENEPLKKKSIVIEVHKQKENNQNNNLPNELPKLKNGELPKRVRVRKKRRRKPDINNP